MPASAELLQKGRYRVDSSAPIGSGQVYPAYDTTSDTNVYVKEIVVRLNKVTTLAQQENSRLAFENAARRISEMRHDSILRVTDFYSEVGRQYLVLEDVEGDDLQTILDRDRMAFPIEMVLDWADQLLDAVNYLHVQQPPVIHKNICPRNVRLSPAGKVKVLGLAITDDTGNDLSTALLETNDGSLNFSPLELIWDSLDAASQKVILTSYDERSEKTLKESIDVRSDLYAVGATLYYLLTARTPVDPLERSIELLEGNSDPLKAPNIVDTRIAPEISDVVMRALEIKRENRYDSATIMRQVLRTAVVRVKEREAAEAQEMEEAAEFLRSTQQLKIPEGTAEAFESPQPRDAGILAQKLREAEEMRLEAERRVAEAERLLREQQAERERLEALANAASELSNDQPGQTVDDDLLEISTEPFHVSNPPDEAVAPEDDIHLSIRPEPRAKIDLRQLAKAPEPLQSIRPEPAEDEPFLLEEEPVVEAVSPAPMAGPEPAFASYSYEEDSPKRSGLPIPLIAAAAALIVIASVVGYMFLGGSAPAAVQETQNIAVPQQQAEQPAAVETEPVVEQQTTQPERQVNTFAETEQPQPTQASTDQPATEPHSAAKPAKAKLNAETAKTPAPKKKVTVDDLINDN